MKNSSGISPIEYKVLILADKVDEKSKGGIIIPDESKDRKQFAQMEGVLVAVSPFAFTYENWSDREATQPKPGDRVLFAKYAGANVTGRDGVEYRMVNDKDVAAVLDA